MHRPFLLCLASLAVATELSAQGISGKEFEVVSIRVPQELSREEYSANPGSRIVQIDKGFVTMPYARMEIILQRAFGVTRPQLIAPEWTQSRYFSIEAKLPPDAAQGDVPEMLRNMLVARFHMGYHKEVRNTTVLVLASAKGGTKAEAAAAESRSRRRGIEHGGTHFDLTTTSVGLADFLAQRTFGPVVDRTGLAGTYLFSFDFYPFGKLGGDGNPLGPPTNDFFADLVRHYDDALAPIGLRLTPAKLPMENVIIDQLDRTPTEN